MKKILVGAVLVSGLLLSLPRAQAADSVLSYTATQSNNIRTILIPEANRRKCSQYGGLPATCTAVQLTANGCVTRVARTLTVETCSIWTQDAAGEQGFLQEQENRRLVEILRVILPPDPADFCYTWGQLSRDEQNDRCEKLGLPSNCTPCS